MPEIEPPSKLRLTGWRTWGKKVITLQSEFSRATNLGATERFRVTEVHHELQGVRSYTLNGNLQFEPGQSSLVTLPGSRERGALLLTPVDETSFRITVASQGRYGTSFVKQVKRGLDLEFTAPFGKGLLRSTDERPLCVLARDHHVILAMALFRCLIAQANPLPFTLMHEVSDPCRVLFDADFRDHHLPGFRRYLFLDGPMGNCFWPGMQTRITADQISEHIEDPRETHFVVCGGPAEVRFFADQLGQLPLNHHNLSIVTWD